MYKTLFAYWFVCVRFFSLIVKAFQFAEELRWIERGFDEMRKNGQSLGWAIDKNFYNKVIIR